MSSKLFLPQPFPCFSDFVDYRLFAHAFVWRTGLRHKLANPGQAPFYDFNIFSHIFLPHLKNNTFLLVSQEELGVLSGFCF
jgi:hypothetical protein